MNDYQRTIFALRILNAIIEEVNIKDVKDFYNDEFYPSISQEDASAVLKMIKGANVELI